MMTCVDADAVIAALELAPHPEGGQYRETWVDANCSVIYYLLRPGENSLWHRVRGRAEVWAFHAGDALRLQVNPEAPQEEGAEVVVLGPAVDRGQRPHAVVPADAWQSASSLGAWTLVSCVVAPPFSFDAFDLVGGGTEQRD